MSSAPVDDSAVQVWTLADGPGTRLHFFEDGCAVFNPNRWETHVVDLLVGTMLEAMASSPHSRQALMEVAVDASDLDPPAAERFVADAIAQLMDLDLVRETPVHAHR